MCGLEKLGVVDQNWLERNVSSLLLRTLIVGRRQQSVIRTDYRVVMVRCLFPCGVIVILSHWRRLGPSFNPAEVASLPHRIPGQRIGWR